MNLHLSGFVAASEAAMGSNRLYTNKTVNNTVTSPNQHGSDLRPVARKIETRPFCVKQVTNSHK